MKSLQSFVFIGRSGCGKGTQAKLLIDALKSTDPEHGTLYVQSGEELREFTKGSSYTEQLCKKLADEGGLMPEFLIVHFWTKRLVEHYTGNEHLVIDGSPRKYHEALVMDSMFDFYKIARPEIIYLNVSEDWSRGRLMDRHRADDASSEIDNRLAWFNTQVVPTIEYYRKNSLYKFHEIDGERSIAEVYADIKALIKV